MNKVLKEILSTGIYLLVVLFATYLLITYVVQRTEVNGASMEPTLHNGDNLFVDKITYRFNDPERFDVIVFPFHYQEETYYIKRIIGLPGETVQIDENGVIYINGEVLTESFGKEVIQADKIGLRQSPLCLARMNILFLVTIVMTVLIVDMHRWETSVGTKSSDVHGLESGLLMILAL